MQYRYGHIPLPVLAFNNGACTGTGISALWFSTGRGTVHYQNWHSKMMPVPVLSFLHFGSVPVKAKSITGTGIQLWCLYRVLAFRYFDSVSVLAWDITGTGIEKYSTDKKNLRVLVWYQQQYHYWKITIIKLLTVI